MQHFTSYDLEHAHWTKNLLVCGVDEVGRGCLAGPVITAAAILKPYAQHPKVIDSKKLNKQNLLLAYHWLMENCMYSIAISSQTIIDKHNIYQATKKTMQHALINLLIKETSKPSLILIDAMPLTLTQTPFDNIPIISLTQGESKSASIAAASIIAKVTRDQILTRLSKTFPNYGFENHKGYGTKQHQNNLSKLNPCILHRETFLKKFLTNKNNEQQSIFC